MFKVIYKLKQSVRKYDDVKKSKFFTSYSGKRTEHDNVKSVSS